MRLEGLNLDGFPVAALAAYGLLRVLEERLGLGVKLSFDLPWERPVACLHGVDKEGVLQHLVQYAKGVQPSDYGLPNEDEEDKEEEKAVCQKLQRRDGASSYLVAYLNPWFCSEKRKSKDWITTPFDTTSGRQKFLGLLGKVASAFRELEIGEVKQDFERALFENVILPPDSLEGGTGRSGREIPDLKWHRVRCRQTATQSARAAEEPKDQTLRIRPSALLLALEALPLYPFPPGRSPLPLGFKRGEKGPILLLPTPGSPVDTQTLRALVALAPLLPERCPDVPVWASPKIRVGKSYPCFGEADLYRPGG